MESLCTQADHIEKLVQSMFCVLHCSSALLPQGTHLGLELSFLQKHTRFRHSSIQLLWNKEIAKYIDHNARTYKEYEMIEYRDTHSYGFNWASYVRYPYSLLPWLICVCL